MKRMVKQARQGDILYIRVERPIPDNATVQKPRADGSLVVAEGEATGHCHAVLGENIEMFETTAQAVDKWLRVKGPAVTTHPDHQPGIALPHGTIIARRKLEYSPAELRRVAD